jgi:microcystin-dependent protein
MAEPFIGEIKMFGGNFAPTNYAMCNGQLIAISQNTALFSILGTTFGGNGQTTFGLPDFRGRVPVHQGQGNGLSPYTMGEVAGSESITLLNTQMPAHNHTVAVVNTPGNVIDPTNALPAEVNNGTVRAPKTDNFGFSNATATGTLAPTAVSMSGGNQPHENRQPFLCVNFIIALYGIFPSRN